MFVSLEQQLCWGLFKNPSLLQQVCSPLHLKKKLLAAADSPKYLWRLTNKHWLDWNNRELRAAGPLITEKTTHNKHLKYKTHTPCCRDSILRYKNIVVHMETAQHLSTHDHTQRQCVAALWCCSASAFTEKFVFCMRTHTLNIHTHTSPIWYLSNYKP